jgi:glycosyltransferase involved in cell wall biosynthesis
MKLLVLGYELPPIGGGTGQSLQHLLNALSQAVQWEIEVWTAASPVAMVRKFPSHVRIIEFSCGKRDLHYWRSGEMAWLLWKTWRQTLGDSPLPDVILVWGGLPLAPLLLGSLGQVPTVIALRGSDVPGFNPRTSGLLWSSFSKMVWQKAACLTTNSPALARMVKKMIAIEGWDGLRTVPDFPRLEVIPNGVISLPSTRQSPSPLSWGSHHHFTLLCVSRLIPRKRIAWVIEALAMLPGEIRSRTNLKIVGEGPERYRLEAMVAELDLASRVTFLGLVPPQEMPNLYLTSDLLVHPSSAEGLSNAVMESLASGMPVLCTEPTGFQDLDEVLLAAKSIQHLAQQIETVLSQPEWYLQLSEKGRAVASRYTWEHTARRYVDLLESLVRKESHKLT